jgi:hypothetical protein
MKKSPPGAVNRATTSAQRRISGSQPMTPRDVNFSSGYAIYTVDFAAGSSNQMLTVRYFAEALNDLDFGNVTWQAATLATLVPTIFALQPPLPGATFSGSFLSLQGINYTVEHSATIESPLWSPLTNMMGNGSNAVFSDTLPMPSGFYRLKVN